jgi:hypothetical protein
LRGAVGAAVRQDVLRPNGWIEAHYNALCAYVHSRPDASDGELWRSNGPVYVATATELVFKLQMSTYAGCYVLAMIGRPQLLLPQHSQFLFTSLGVLSLDEIASSYNALCRLR